MSFLCLINCNSGTRENAGKSAVHFAHDNRGNAGPIVYSAVNLRTIGLTNGIEETEQKKLLLQAKTYIVKINNMKFTPATIKIKKGDKVTFVNNDIVEHNATEKGKAWASPLLQNGQSWTFKPEKNCDYYCTVHVVMQGKIIVE